jgi:hypothetical protein
LLTGCSGAEWVAAAVRGEPAVEGAYVGAGGEPP